MVKRLSAMWENQVWSLGQEDPLEKEMATHSSTLAWKIPWIEEPGRLQSMGSKRVRHDWATSLYSLWSQDTCRVNLHLVQTGRWSQTQQGLQAPDLCILHQLPHPRFHGKKDRTLGLRLFFGGCLDKMKQNRWSCALNESGDSTPAGNHLLASCLKSGFPQSRH